jgi:hypothetical protein
MLTPADIVRAKRRARAPASPLDRRYGQPPTIRPVPPRRPYAARPMDKTANAKANGTNRSYSYETAEETWLNGRKG